MYIMMVASPPPSFTLSLSLSPSVHAFIPRARCIKNLLLCASICCGVCPVLASWAPRAFAMFY